MARRKYASAVSGSSASACRRCSSISLSFSASGDPLSQRMRARSEWAAPAISGRSSSRLVQDGHGLVGTTVVHEDAGLEKLGFRSDVLAVKDGFDRLQGGFAVGLGILLAGLGQDAPMPEAFGLGQLEPVPIPQGKHDHRRTSDRLPWPARRWSGSGAGGGTSAGDTSVLGPRARTGSCSRCRRTSSARPLAVSYRRARSFSRDFITIQSRSPRTALAEQTPGRRVCGSLATVDQRRLAASGARTSVEGLTGSCSRMTRCISM